MSWSGPQASVPKYFTGFTERKRKFHLQWQEKIPHDWVLSEKIRHENRRPIKKENKLKVRMERNKQVPHAYLMAQPRLPQGSNFTKQRMNFLTNPTPIIHPVPQKKKYVPIIN